MASDIGSEPELPVAPNGSGSTGTPSGVQSAAARPVWVPRIRSVLLVLVLLILSLPLGGISLLKLCDTVLIRQTESELIAQGAVLAAAFHRELEQELPISGLSLRQSAVGALPKKTGRRFRPIPPRLDLARDKIWPPASAAIPAESTDPVAAAAGARLREVLEETQEITLAGLRVVDRHGTVVATSGSELGLGLGHRPEVASALTGVALSMLRLRTGSQGREEEDTFEPSLSRRTGIRVVLALPVIVDDEVVGAVVLARTPQSVARALYENRWSFLPGALGLVGVAGLVALITARTLRRPLDALIEQTARIRRGEPGGAELLARPGIHEIQQISAAISEMASELQQRADYISTFASNVSHELKTPLTSIRGTVELLRDHRLDMSAEESERFLAMLDQDAERLELLIARLLELARAEVVRPGGEVVDLGSVLTQMLDRYRADGFDVRLGSPTPPMVEIGMAPEVLESVLGNLIDNARHHGGAEVIVEIMVWHVGERVTIRVADNGPGISAANRDRIFDRFFTTARDRGQDGLGLTIVRSLVEAHEGRIRVDPRSPGTEITVELPTRSSVSA